MSNTSVLIREFGLIDYSQTWQQMKDFTLARDSQSQDELWVLQHYPVFTQGQTGKAEHILDARDIPIQKTDRGGQVTYHGPGQLIIYLLIDVKRNKMGVRDLVDGIENSIISVLQSYQIKAETTPRAPGVYVAGEKIAALGLRIKKGCCYHGLSLNVDMDLEPFSFINPCGYKGMKTTQIKNLLSSPKEQLFDDVQLRLVQELATNLGYSSTIK